MKREEALANIGKRVVYKQSPEVDETHGVLREVVKISGLYFGRIDFDGGGKWCRLLECLTLEEQPAPEGQPLSDVIIHSDHTPAGASGGGGGRMIKPTQYVNEDKRGAFVGSGRSVGGGTGGWTAEVRCKVCGGVFLVTNSVNINDATESHKMSLEHQKAYHRITSTRTEIRENIETLSLIIREIGGGNFPVTINRNLWLALGNEFESQSQAYLESLKEGR